MWADVTLDLASSPECRSRNKWHDDHSRCSSGQRRIKLHLFLPNWCVTCTIPEIHLRPFVTVSEVGIQNCVAKDAAQRWIHAAITEHGFWGRKGGGL